MLLGGGGALAGGGVARVNENRLPLTTDPSEPTRRA